MQSCIKFQSALYFLQNSALHICDIQSTAFSVGEDDVSVKVAVKLNT